MSRDARTLDSLKGARFFFDAWRIGILEEILGSSNWEAEGDLLECLMSHHGSTEREALPIDPHREESMVLFDMTDEASESESGDERPEDVVEYTDGLSGRIDDSDIQ